MLFLLPISHYHWCSSPIHFPYEVWNMLTSLFNKNTLEWHNSFTWLDACNYVYHLGSFHGDLSECKFLQKVYMYFRGQQWRYKEKSSLSLWCKNFKHSRYMDAGILFMELYINMSWNRSFYFSLYFNLFSYLILEQYFHSCIRVYTWE